MIEPSNLNSEQNTSPQQQHTLSISKGIDESIGIHVLDSWHRNQDKVFVGAIKIPE